MRLRPLARLAGLLALSIGLTATPALAGPPMSRGQQFFPISHEECLQRANQALVSAGYRLWGQLGNGPWGDRGQHSAVILCEPAAGNREVVLIVVASDGTSDANVPGAERVRLQELMGGAAHPTPSPQPQPAPPSQPGGSSKGCVGFRGNWDTTWGSIAIRVQGNLFEGDHPAYGGKFNGTISGNVAEGKYSLSDGRYGTFRWTLGADGNGFLGDYQDLSNLANKGGWNGECKGGGGDGLRNTASQQMAISWNTSAEALGLAVGHRLTVTCPPDGFLSPSLWGTDLYSSDSSICAAAVHYSRITVAAGGTVTIEGRQGVSSYLGSTRNGVQSKDYPQAWGGSFVFVVP